MSAVTGTHANNNGGLEGSCLELPGSGFKGKNKKEGEEEEEIVRIAYH